MKCVQSGAERGTNERITNSYIGYKIAQSKRKLESINRMENKTESKFKIQSTVAPYNGDFSLVLSSPFIHRYVFFSSQQKYTTVFFKPKHNSYSEHEDQS